MTTELADAIAAKSLVGNDGSPQTDSINARATTVWLLAEGLTDVTTMRQLDRFITGRGSVYRVQVIGHYDQDGPIVRREAVIDASLKPPRLILQRDLSPLGPGYRPPAWDSNPTREASTR